MKRVLYETGSGKYVGIRPEDGEVIFVSDIEKAWTPSAQKQDITLNEIKDVFGLQWLSTLEWRVYES
jgi:hypothetical protein